MKRPTWPIDQPFTSAEARARGLSRAQVEGALCSGELTRVSHNVYLAATLADDIRVLAAAVQKVAGPGQVVCDRSAALLHGIDPYSPHEHLSRLRIELVGGTTARRGSVAGGKRTLADSDVTDIEGIRVTSAARTVVDLACALDPGRALGVVDAFLRAGLVTKVELITLSNADRMRGRRGIRLARSIIQLGDARSESFKESAARMAIALDGLPVPDLQVVATGPNGTTYRLDLGYADLRIAIEFDGREFHGPDRAAHDEARRRWLRDHGWYVIVLRNEDLIGVNRDAWLAKLADVIAERRALGGWKRRGRRAAL